MTAENHIRSALLFVVVVIALALALSSLRSIGAAHGATTQESR